MVSQGELRMTQLE